MNASAGTSFTVAMSKAWDRATRPELSPVRSGGGGADSFPGPLPFVPLPSVPQGVPRPDRKTPTRSVQRTDPIRTFCHRPPRHLMRNERRDLDLSSGRGIEVEVGTSVCSRGGRRTSSGVGRGGAVPRIPIGGTRSRSGVNPHRSSPPSIREILLRHRCVHRYPSRSRYRCSSGGEGGLEIFRTRTGTYRWFGNPRIDRTRENVSWCARRKKNVGQKRETEP